MAITISCMKEGDFVVSFASSQIISFRGGLFAQTLRDTAYIRNADKALIHSSGSEAVLS